MISAEAVANFFIDKAGQTGCGDLTPMKLQKLVYFAHGWHLGLWSKPLIDEKIEAWQYGPVIRTLYREFKEFGNNAIARKAKNVRYDDGQVVEYEPDIGESNEHDVVADLLDRIWEIYGDYTPIQLSNLTHEDGTPWDQVAASFGNDLPRRMIHIPNELIQTYFESLAQQDRAA